MGDSNWYQFRATTAVGCTAKTEVPNYGVQVDGIHVRWGPKRFNVIEGGHIDIVAKLCYADHSLRQ
jgi:hypothetical protein